MSQTSTPRWMQAPEVDEERSRPAWMDAPEIDAEPTGPVEIPEADANPYTDAYDRVPSRTRPRLFRGGVASPPAEVGPPTPGFLAAMDVAAEVPLEDLSSPAGPAAPPRQPTPREQTAALVAFYRRFIPDVTPAEALSMYAARQADDAAAQAGAGFAAGIGPPGTEGQSRQMARNGLRLAEDRALAALRSADRSGQAGAEKAAGETAGYRGRASAAFQGAVVDALNQPGESLDMMAERGILPLDVAPRRGGNFGAEMIGLDAGEARAISQVGAQADPLTRTAASLPALPLMMADPVGSIAVLGTGGMATAAMRTKAGTALLDAIGRRTSPAVAREVGALLASTGGASTAMAIDAALRYPGWGEDPEGGIQAMLEAAGEGAKVGGLFYGMHAAAKAPGAVGRAARSVAERAEVRRGERAAADAQAFHEAGQLITDEMRTTPQTATPPVRAPMTTRPAPSPDFGPQGVIDLARERSAQEADAARVRQTAELDEQGRRIAALRERYDAAAARRDAMPDARRRAKPELGSGRLNLPEIAITPDQAAARGYGYEFGIGRVSRQEASDFAREMAEVDPSKHYAVVEAPDGWLVASREGGPPPVTPRRRQTDPLEAATWPQVKERARSLGIDPAKRTRREVVELIRAREAATDAPPPPSAPPVATSAPDALAATPDPAPTGVAAAAPAAPGPKSPGSAPWTMTKAQAAAAGIGEAQHRRAVFDAIDAGEKIPPAVAADYPGIEPGAIAPADAPPPATGSAPRVELERPAGEAQRVARLAATVEANPENAQARATLDNLNAKAAARFKAKHPEVVLLVRTGDGYRTFDAADRAKVVGATGAETIAAEGLELGLRKLIEKGHRVAVAETAVPNPGDTAPASPTTPATAQPAHTKPARLATTAPAPDPIAGSVARLLTEQRGQLTVATIARDTGATPRQIVPALARMLEEGAITPERLDAAARALVDRHIRDNPASPPAVASPDGDAVRRVADLIHPGEDFGAMGASENPAFERGPDGQIRPRVRSAADLVGRMDQGATASPHAFADPATEARYQAAKRGLGKIGLVNRLRMAWDELVKSTTRGALPELPRTQRFGEARSALAMAQRARAYAQHATEELLARVVKPLGRDAYDLFVRKVILDDLAQTDGGLPFGLKEADAAAELARIDRAVAASPAVQAAIEYRRKMWEAVKGDYLAAMKSIGIDLSKRLRRKDYFRHQVLYYTRLKQLADAGVATGYGPGRKLVAPTKRGFLQAREGSNLDINANYIEAEWEIVSQMLADTEIARALARVKKRYDILPQLQRKAKEAGGEATWEDFVPEGYTAFTMRPGRALFVAEALSDSVAQRIFEQVGEAIGVGPEDLRKVVALGAEHKPLVVPIEVAAQLEHLSRGKKLGPIDKAATRLVGLWKQWQLHQPRRVIGYNLRNASEVEKAVALNPGTLAHVPRAIGDLYKLFKRAEDTPAEVLEWKRRGGAMSLTRINELGDVNRLGRFARLLENQGKSVAGKVAAAPATVWRGYWETAGLASDFRESILRYAAYLDYLDQVRGNGGKPRNYGGSVRAEVDGIADPRDKAFRLSADLLGDYGDVSQLGQWMRQRVFPFWSFQELNARAYWNGVRNLSRDGVSAWKIGAKLAPNLARTSVAMTMRLGQVAAMFYGLQAGLSAVNHILSADDEAELPEDVQRRPHITLGRDAQGRVRYFGRLGASSDFLEWFGADALAYDVNDLLHGRKTLRELAIDYAKSPVNKIVQGSAPFTQEAVEAIVGRKLFPDVFNADRQLVFDRWANFFQGFGLEHEYKALAGKPTRGYADSLSLALVSKIEPGQAAYWSIRDKAADFERSEGRGGSGGSGGDRAAALHNFKLAVRLKDQDAAVRYLIEFAALGGSEKNIEDSLKRAHPLGGLAAGARQRFLDQLSDDDRQLLHKAETFWRSVLVGEPEDYQAAAAAMHQRLRGNSVERGREESLPPTEQGGGR